MGHCLNCNSPIVEGQNFCSNCGQKTAIHRLSLHDILHDVVHYFTHADKGIFQLLKALGTKTGTVAREFVSGKRKKYFPPLNFFLIVAAIYLLIGGLLRQSESSRITTVNTNTYSSQKTSSPAAAYSQKQARKMGEVRYMLIKYANFVAMFAAPFISLLVWLIYLKGRYNFTEHLVANLYLIGFTNLVRCLLFMPSLKLLSIDSESRMTNLSFVAFEILYRAIFYYRFMNELNTKGKLKAIGIAFISAAAWWLLIFGLIFVYMIID